MGLPKAKGRARASGRIVGAPGHQRVAITMRTPAETAALEKVIALEFKRRFPGHSPHTGPVMLRFTAVFPIPKSFTGKRLQAAKEGRLLHTARPDKDNIEKLVCDALNGIAWMDDAQVQGGGVKRYGTQERIDVSLEFLTNPYPTDSDQRRLKLQRAPRLGI